MYGKFTSGVGSDEQREHQVVDFVKALFLDNRLISIGQIEDGSYVCSVENPSSTGRNPNVSIWLTKESLMGLLSTAMLYFSIKGEDINKILQESVEGKAIEYSFSDNLKPIN